MDKQNTVMDRKNFLRSLTGVGLLGFTTSAVAADVAKPNPSSDVRLFGAKGDGKTDDTSAFQKALKATGQAFVPPGVWCLSELKLDGGELIGVGTLKAVNEKDVVQVSGQGARIIGLKFATTNSRTRTEIRLLDGAQDVTVAHCHFEGKAYSVLSADVNTADDDGLKYKMPVSHVHFFGNTCRGYTVPLYLHSVIDLIITDNYFTESFYDAIRTRQAVERAIISQNIFENVGVSTEEVTRDAIDCFWSGRELIITSNIVKKTGSIGFDLKGHEPKGRYHSGHILVANNYLEDTNYSSILLSSGGANKTSPVLVGPIAIKNNLIVNGNRKGQSEHDAAIWLHHGVQHVQVMGNQIRSHRGHGISLSHAFIGAEKSRLIQVCDNMITGCRYKGVAAGVYFQQIEMLQIRQNMVEGCDLVWKIERVPNPRTFRESLQIEGNLFKGVGKAIPDTDWATYILTTNRVVN